MAAKVLSVSTDPEYPGWLFVLADSAKAKCLIAFAIPPEGEKFRGPKVRVIARPYR